LFLGNFEHNIDSKNRLRLPPKFKKDFSGEIVLTKGNDGCVFIVPKEQFDNVFKRASELPMFSSTAQKPLRMLFSSASILEEDNQGRFLLPTAMKEYAKIDKNVVFVGAGNRVELWAKEKWEIYSSNQNFDELLKELGDYGI
jgi:MraZ protein